MINNVQSNSVDFKGFYTSKASNKARQYTSSLVANITKQQVGDVLILTQDVTKNRLGFLEAVAHRYNTENFYRSAVEREKGTLVNDIFLAVEKPTKEYYKFMSMFNGSMSTLYRIFSATNNSLKRLAFAQKVNSEVMANHKNVNKNIIPELLESEHSDEYVNNYNKYKSYVTLHKNDANAVKALDEMVTNKTYNRETYDKQLEKISLMQKFPFGNSEIFNSEIFADNFTETRYNLLKGLHSNFNISGDISLSGIDKELLQLFSTTNNKNYKLRELIINRYSQQYNRNSEEIASSLGELNKLFETLESDEDAKKFVQKITINNCLIKDTQTLNNILDRIPSKKLLIFRKNAENIINQTRNNPEQIDILEKELENAFYQSQTYIKSSKYAESYGCSKPAGFIQKALTQFANKIRIARYKFTTPGVEKPIEKPVAQPVIKQAEIAETTAIAEIKKPFIAKEHKTEVFTQVAATEIKPVVEETSADPTLTETKTKTKTKTELKEEVRKNIFEIAASKLGKKTFAKQREEYGKGATKMRLGMLPEIFASISDTRKADRAVGKYRINSSNKDALDLFTLINGSNKKFINYLLKKRNVDNTRMFEVKDIIEMVRKAESKIAAEKQCNPEYRARDARKYYNHLYESKIEQYGKVKRQNKINTKA